MKFRLVTFLFILIVTISCDKKTVLETTFDCSSSYFYNVDEFTDTKNNFKIDIPSGWKTTKYYDEYQSALFVADTTQQLTETYIIDISWKSGELELNKEFVEKAHADTSLDVIHSEFENILQQPSFWYLSKGKKNNFEYHILSIYIKTSVDFYMQISTEIYGNEDLDKRLCEAISIIKTIELI